MWLHQPFGRTIFNFEVEKNGREATNAQRFFKTNFVS